MAGVGAPGDEGGEGGTVDGDFGVEGGAFVGGKRFPVGDGFVPVVAGGGEFAAVNVVEGGLVGGDHAGAGAGLDGHVADGHAGFHGEFLDGFTTVFDDVSLPTTSADLSDDGEDEVFGCDTGLEFPGDVDGHGFERFEGECLGGHDVFDFGGADAERHGAERTVGGGVGVAAHDGHAGLGGAELGADLVDDALVDVPHGVEAHPEFFAVFPQGGDLGAGDTVGDFGQVTGFDAGGGDIVVFGSEVEFGVPEGAAGKPKAIEGLGGGYFVE